MHYTVYAAKYSSSSGPVVTVQISYVLEKPNGDYLYIDTCGICPWRKNMTAFLADNAEALAGLEEVKAKELGKYLLKICR